MQTHGCPDFSRSKEEWPECLLLSTGCQDPLTSFIAYLNSFDLPRRRAQGTKCARTAGRAALDRPLGCLELGVS